MKIVIDRAVVEQALEALEYYEHRRLEWDYKDEQAISALRAALEQPQGEQEPTKPKCVAIIEVFDRDWRMDYLSLPVGRHKLYVQEYSYIHPQPPRQPLTCNSCKGLGRVYRGCNEWAACVHCNTTGIGGEK